MTTPAKLITGVILAGGASSRMGVDKALLPIRGVPMIQHVADTMRSVFDLVCIASDHAEEYGFLQLPGIRDIYPLHGPLGGIHAALSSLDTDAIFVLGCDTPFVSESLITYIVQYHTTAAVRIAQTAERVHPLCGVYSRACLPTASSCLAAGRLKMLRFLDEVGAAYVPITGDLSWYHDNLLANINAPGDLLSNGSLNR